MDLQTPPGTAFSYEVLQQAITEHKPAVLFLCQGESSTGVHQNLAGISELCHEHGTLLLVDTVCTLGGIPLHADAWGIDAIYSGSQKVLGAPPGESLDSAMTMTQLVLSIGLPPTLSSPTPPPPFPPCPQLEMAMLRWKSRAHPASPHTPHISQRCTLSQQSYEPVSCASLLADVTHSQPPPHDCLVGNRRASLH